ncbi:MAG: exodeoxyribonuclease V subunit alpha [Desulfuromonadaceae bacterium]|nr:exodeoxyribonuclease V subunit alpha [Desulfuromonadaceae bacterium]MDD2847280.1 exodeoxyribonuclease V subunit alpha [Desulfuromonadaceae bacterium]MDD4130224.1 exodeoxyribonuclease V subunit alpha [Desulfuromonadaceae bacterium]
MTETIKLSTLDVHFADFIVRIDSHPSDELWWGAALASHAAGRGHTCFNLSALLNDDALPLLSTARIRPPSDTALWLESLKKCDTVGAPGAFTPLVLDPAGRLYLHRCWGYEQQITAGILSRSRPLATSVLRLDDALDRYFSPHGDTVDLQREAARMALTHRFSVISGGPGTGKTATVARILALLLDLSGDVRPEITLAAPTGKAAMRLHQSILQAAERLDLPDGVRNSLPVGVSTIHRLLGVQARGGGFRHNRDKRLPCDILVVDEASMVDLQLMASLMEALRDDARIILLGDRNQLASVEAGAVLADICDSAAQANVPVTQLTRSYRFGADSGIAALSNLINSGESAAAVELLKSGRYPDVVWRQVTSGRAFESAFSAAARDGFAGYAGADSPGAALAELGSFRVLSPLRSGPFGVENLNRLCRNALASGGKSDHPGLRLMPVMITGNNYELGLFNGDTGVVVESDGPAAVWFENPDGGLRHISALRLPPGEAAFALTVHKSQGSEFDRVLLILPDHLSGALSRELLYTAVTRARQHIEIWGSEEVLCQAVERRTVRSSGLGDRLVAGG